MSVPKFFEFFDSFLKVLEDKEIHSAKEVKAAISKQMGLSEDDLGEMLPSGRQTTFGNRVMWARTYLNKAGLIETPSRGNYRITDEGIKALQSGKSVDLKYLEQYDSFKKFHTVSTIEDHTSDETETDESPMEVLDSAFNQVNNSLASELMEEVMRLTPTEFEKLVVKLLIHMGYGSGIDGAGKVTQQTNDGGIDGIIQEDQLGFSNIYIQAKQWATDRTIAKPEIQKFVGALQGKQAQKGLFITTAQFTEGAKQYVENLLGAKVVLVDGDMLMKLMIKYNVGVSVEHVYEVKKIDSDFFTDEL